MNKNEMIWLAGFIASVAGDIVMVRILRDERIAERKARYEKILNKHNESNSFSKEESES